MLFDREWAGVELGTEDLDIWEESGPEATKRKREQLGNDLQQKRVD
jgi:hypothetical protein